MNIGVISDTHGSKENIEIIIERFNNVDMFIHAGDNYQDAQVIERKKQVPVISVKGNCDYGDWPLEEEFFLAGKKIFLTHGHKYGVKYNLQRLYFRAKELEADCCIFGHSHIASIDIIDSIWFLNPGSLTWPRGKMRYLGILLRINEGVINCSLLDCKD